LRGFIADATKKKNQDKKKPGNVMRRGDFDASRPVHQRTIP
jgi:hypothetical protein